ncbi:hypothetical protein HQ619_07850 [Burkholderia gladioli]|jgi:hypothetical protein|uniref:hypothetical protein n=1 Tax=Burkholderia gladioli TaxID=28095 RepID=UPI00156149E1|nr:hypothetical protein [Burkholderia gladioli]NRF83839.1 hypothetical protein [Burkholderia gladioli]
MSLAAIAQKERAKRLIPRLDACAGRIDEESIVRSHAMVYAAFLTDYVAGRIDVANPETVGMLSLADEFCELIEQEYPVTN